MAKSNCQFNGAGGQYFTTVLIHVIILGSITFGLYSPWAWVMVFRKRASHTMINGKTVTFTGTGLQLFLLVLVYGLLTLITVGLYGPWAMCKFFTWKAQNTLVDGKPSEFSGKGGSLFVFYLIHLFILPILTLGLYYFVGLYRLYGWKEEHSKYGGEKTTFGAGFGEFFKITLISWILTPLTFYLFTPWALCMLFKWQVTGLAVGDDEKTEHFPPVKVNPIIVIVLIVIGLIPFLLLGKKMIEQSDKAVTALKPISQPGHQVAGKKSKKIDPATGVARKPREKTPRAKKELPSKKTRQKKIPNLDKEIRALDDRLKKQPKDADAFYNRGILYASKGDLEQAIIDYSAAIKIEKNHGDAHYNRGLAYVKKERYGEAVRDFSAVIESAPDSVDALCNRGNAYYQLGNYNAAIKDYTTAMKWSPGDADLYHNRGIAHGANGAEQDALKDTEKAAQLGGNKLEKSSGGEDNQAVDDLVMWRDDLAHVEMPAIAAEGMIHGDRFTVESASVENSVLTIRDGKDFFPDHALMIFLFLKKGETAAGKTFNITRTSGFSSPHIHMKWRAEGMDVPETEMFMDNYEMRLEFGILENGRLPGKIYVCLPDKMKSYVGGIFNAEIK